MVAKILRLIALAAIGGCVPALVPACATVPRSCDEVSIIARRDREGYRLDARCTVGGETATIPHTWFAQACIIAFLFSSLSERA